MNPFLVACWEDARDGTVALLRLMGERRNDREIRELGGVESLPVRFRSIKRQLSRSDHMRTSDEDGGQVVIDAVDLGPLSLDQGAP